MGKFVNMGKPQASKADHPLKHILKLNSNPTLGLKEKPITNPNAPNVRVFAKGGAVKSFEGSKKDMAQDAKLAAKHKMSMKQWESSSMDTKHDKQESMKGLKCGGGVMKKARGGKIKGTKQVLGTKSEARKLAMLGSALKAKAAMAGPPAGPPVGLGAAPSMPPQPGMPPMKRGGKVSKKKKR